MCVAALSIIGGLISGVGAMQQANAAAESEKAQAEARRRQATIDQDSGAYKAQQQQRNVDRVLGKQRAGFLSSGIALTGSASDVIDESTAEGALDVAAIRWNSQLSADNERYNAKINDMNASNAKAAAPIAFLTPVLSGVAKFGSSFG